MKKVPDFLLTVFRKIVSILPRYLLFWVMYFLSFYIFKVRNKIKVVGKENLPRETGILYVSSHQTLIDSLLIGANVISLWELLLLQIHIPYNAPDMKNFFSHWFGKHFIRMMKCVPVQRGSKSLSVLKKQVNVYCNILKRSNLLLFFEGTRSRTGEIGKCKYGVAATVLKAKDIKVVPIRLIGVNQIMPIESGFKYRKIFFGKKGYMIIGKPIDFEDILSSTDIEQIKIDLIK